MSAHRKKANTAEGDREKEPRSQKPRKPKPPLTGDEEWLTVEEAAVILRVGRYVAYQAAERGELPGVVRVGRFYRVRKAALLGTAPGVMPE